MGGGVIWVATMGRSCKLVDPDTDSQDVNEFLKNDVVFNTDVSEQSCLAFDPVPAPNRFQEEANSDTFDWDPIANVLMLRKIVVLLWYPLLPLIHWTKGNAPRCLPGFMRRYWFEIAYYSHVLVAHASFLLAMFSRFEVFYPSLFTWVPYYIDSIREIILRTYTTQFVICVLYTGGDDGDSSKPTTVIHMDKKGVPTAMKLIIDVPPTFRINAGQYLYVKVPEISRIQWHPFSLASGSLDQVVELHVGVRGEKSQWAQDGNGNWRQVKRPTFTFQLYQKLRERIVQMSALDDPERDSHTVPPLVCQLRGPYGSTFTKCFDPHYAGAVVIGAGTGLTAAESVLREIIHRRRAKKRTPKYIWFVWSCSRVDDLLWVWDTLHDLILEACKDGVLNPGRKWSKASNMLDWLGVTIYVTRADKDKLRAFLGKPTGGVVSRSGAVNTERPEASARKMKLSKLRDQWVSTNTAMRRNAIAEELREWMGNEKRLLSASLDDGNTHIRRLLAWVRLFIDRKAGARKDIAICFCGPSSLAHVISAASRGVGSVEFTADSQ